MITLGIDLSTQSCTVVALECDLASILGTWSFSFGNSQCVKKYGISASTKTLVSTNEERIEEGRYVQPPSMFLYALDAVFETMKSQKFDFSGVSAIAVSAQQHGHVYLNGEYVQKCETLHRKKYASSTSLEERFFSCYSHPHAPIWMTSNTGKEAKHLKEQVPDILSRTGSESPLRFTGAIIRKVITDYPRDYQNTMRIHLLSSFITSVLVGNADAPIDFGNGAGTSLMHYTHKTWDEALLAACTSGLVDGAETLRAKLPDIESPCKLCGQIAAYFVQRYGFSSSCAVVAGSGDNPQTKVLSHHALLSLGSSFVMMGSCCESAEDIVCHPHTHAMYDGLENPFLFACRTNGALVWDKLRSFYGMSIADGENALRRVSIHAHSRPLFWQPLEESFPRSTPIAWTPTSRERCDTHENFYHDYAALVDTTLALMAGYARIAIKRQAYEQINITGGLASSQEICKRVSAFWNCPVVSVGSVGAGMGAAVCAAKGSCPSLNARALSSALLVRAKITEVDETLQKHATQFTQCVHEQFQNTRSAL